jgi:hypothetical protein
LYRAGRRWRFTTIAHLRAVLGDEAYESFARAGAWAGTDRRYTDSEPIVSRSAHR